MGPIMRYDDRLPRLLAFAIEEKNPRLPDEHRLDYRALDDSLRRLAHEKGATYVSLLGLERSAAFAQELLDEALRALSASGLADTQALQALARMVVNRGN